MNYEEFYYSIDCKFPYHDKDAWKKVINTSLTVGGDAPFLVLHEICRVPASEKLEQNNHREIYDYWKESFSHPVQSIVETASLSYINKEELSDERALDILEKLREYPKSYNAMKIILFACANEDDLVEDKYDEIESEWSNI